MSTSGQTIIKALTSSFIIYYYLLKKNETIIVKIRKTNIVIHPRDLPSDWTLSALIRNSRTAFKIS